MRVAIARAIVAAGIIALIALAVGGAALRANAAAPVAPERALAAGAFVNSIGINVHGSYSDTGYGDHARVAALLDRLGVRHLRDGMVPGRDDVCRADRALGAAGYRFSFITTADPTSAQLRAWVACVGTATEAFEGFNEYDLSHPVAMVDDWADHVRKTQHELYHAVKSTPQLAALMVIGPSLTTEDAFKAVGDLSSDLDAGNMHDYFSFHEPETGGWGFGGYGSLAYDLHAAQHVAAAKPIMATETGYGTDSAKHTVDDVTQATYLPRLLLMQFAAGVPRTYSYELLDEGPDPFSEYGIVHRNFTPKPAYTALQALIGALNDGGAPNAATGSLGYTLDGADSSVHHVLLQKHNGHFVLALWIGTASCDAWSHEARPITQRDITVYPAAPLRSASVLSYGNDWKLHATALAAGAPLHVTISDRVTLLDVTAGAQ